MSNPYDLVVSQIWSDDEEVTLEEIGDRLANLILTLNLPKKQAEAAVRFWLKITNYDDPNRLPPVTDEERAGFLYLAQKIEEGIRQ